MKTKYLKAITIFLPMIGVMYLLATEWSSRTRIRVLEDEIVLRCINILSVLEKQRDAGNTEFFNAHSSLISGSIISLNKIKDSHSGSRYFMYRFKNSCFEHQKISFSQHVQKIVNEIPEHVIDQPPEILHVVEDDRTGYQRIYDRIRGFCERNF
jgi:hypothetical protein